MEKVVGKHTMFPYYGRFLPKERRQKAFQALVSMAGNFHNLLPLPKSKNGKARYLRYCPLCATHDREQYGEAYWHRIHHMIGIQVCPVHRCYLVDSSVIISGKAAPCLTTAEEVIPLSESCVFSDNKPERDVAAYMAEVFQANVDLESGVTAGEYLHSRMANTPYCFIRGEQRNIALFQTDFIEFYKNLPDNWFTELWQIQKVLTGYRVNFYEICLMAMFLGITANEQVRMKLPEKSQQQIFDEEVYRLHEHGLKYPAIAKILNASYETVKAIGEQLITSHSKNRLKAAQSPKTGIKLMKIHCHW